MFIGNLKANHSAMLQNYLKITFRSLLRHRTYTALNVGGMGIGLATGLLLLFWVQHEISFDTFHENAPNLYRVNANVEGFDVWENTPQPLATFARHNLPEVALAARVKEMRRIELFKIGEKRFFEKNYGVVDSTFFLAFNFKMVAGDATKPFQDAKSIVLSVAGLLTKDFLKLVILSLAIASPVAWFFMNKWLESFAYRIDIGWWAFVLAGAVAVAVAFLTVSFQSVKAAVADPVKALRSE